MDTITGLMTKVRQGERGKVLENLADQVKNIDTHDLSFLSHRAGIGTEYHSFFQNELGSRQGVFSQKYIREADHVV